VMALAGCKAIHEVTRPTDESIVVTNADETVVFARRIPVDDPEQFQIVFDGSWCKAQLTKEKHIVVLCDETPGEPKAPVVEDDHAHEGEEAEHE